MEWAACQSPERSRTRDPAVPVEKQGGPAWARDRRLGPERLGQREPGSKIMAGLSPWLSWQQGSGHLSGKVNRKLPVRVSCSLFRVAYSQMKITIKSPAFLSNRSRATSPLPHTCQAGRSLGSRTARSRKRGAPQVSWDLGGGADFRSTQSTCCFLGGSAEPAWCHGAGLCSLFLGLRVK